ncbi:DUF4214 domain-containing protein [Methylobacterium sp. WL103]|uniref:DUF4214 domain-containing protein n=1 Tax=Methylobacterium sp. WL103 TaxID=2603891 RepID=UPI0011CB5889|nr:DUF4214 domain-containing protein [Methylobacterium sp. WL103]TXN02153.1 DUF4214 domain-containing protein [Methylobacterium sp. WL103]
MIYGYARVSTDHQSLAAQIERLTAEGCSNVFQETASGSRADRAALTYFTNELNAGVSQAQVAVQFATSAEAQSVDAKAFSTGVFVPDAIDSAVAREYYAILGRTPDATGLQGFEAQVKQAAASGGANGAIQALGNVANAMLNSSEYVATHAGQTDAGFVDSLFVGALGRHADAGGAAFFADQLAHGISKGKRSVEARRCISVASSS